MGPLSEAKWGPQVSISRLGFSTFLAWLRFALRVESNLTASLARPFGRAFLQECGQSLTEVRRGADGHAFANGDL